MTTNQAVMLNTVPSALLAAAVLHVHRILIPSFVHTIAFGIIQLLAFTVTLIRFQSWVRCYIMAIIVLRIIIPMMSFQIIPTRFMPRRIIGVQAHPILM